MSSKARWFAGTVAILAFVSVGAGRVTLAQTKEAPKPQTWAGKISDNHCGAKKHTMGTDAECVTACVKNGEYVFVGDKDKVFTIANQKFAELPKFAGQTVELTGTAEGDKITVTKIAAKK
jgi:hypothetical protein